MQSILLISIKPLNPYDQSKISIVKIQVPWLLAVWESYSFENFSPDLSDHTKFLAASISVSLS